MRGNRNTFLSSITEANRCASSNAASCTKCLALGPECGWCAQEVCLFLSLFPSFLLLSPPFPPSHPSCISLFALFSCPHSLPPL